VNKLVGPLVVMLVCVSVVGALMFAPALAFSRPVTSAQSVTINETATAADTPAPTQDTAPTMSAFATSAAQAQADAQAAQIQNIEAQSAKLYAEQTAQAAGLALVAATAQAEQLKATQSAADWAGRATQGAQVLTQQAQASANLVAERDAAARMLAAQAENERAKVEAKTAEMQLWAFPASVVALFLIGIGLIWIAATAKRKPEYTADEVDEAEPEQIDRGPNEVFFHSVNITATEKAILRRAALALGGHFSNSKMTSGPDKYFTDPAWRKIDDELLRAAPNGLSYAVKLPDGSLGLTPDGWKWLGLKAPTNPPSEISLNTANLTGVTHHTTPPEVGEVAPIGEEVG